jgi:hypothetical protein
MADRAEAETTVQRWAEFNARDDRYGCWAVEVEAFRLAAP